MNHALDQSNLTIDEAMSLSKKIFSKAGFSQEHATQISTVLVWADSSGHYSHGILRIPQYLKFASQRNIVIGNIPSLMKTEGSTQMVSGNSSAGPIAMRFAVNQLIPLTQKSGIAISNISNTSHIGAAGFYGVQLANAGMISFILAAGVPQMAYIGTATKNLSTAPLAITVPRLEEEHLILDMATSAVASGKIKVATQNKVEIPDSWGLTKEGELTTNPSDIEILLPMGGAKGSGLAFMFEIIASLLGNTPILEPRIGENKISNHTQNATIISIDPTKFISDVALNSLINELIEKLRNEPSQGDSKILMPGERSAKQRAFSIENGIQYSAQLLEDLQAFL